MKNKKVLNNITTCAVVSLNGAKEEKDIPIPFREVMNVDCGSNNKLMIESAYIDENHCVITGWSNGDVRDIENLEALSCEIFFYQRPDVAEFLQSESKKDFGFELRLDKGTENLDLKIDANKTIKFCFDTSSSLNDEALGVSSDLLLKSFRDLPSYSKKVIIVGSAPSAKNHIDYIRSFKGEVWALNDAIFWLEKESIQVSKLFATDQRFFLKSANELRNIHCNVIVSIDTIDTRFFPRKNVYLFKSLGRDGFSLKSGEVYHGCSVLFTALQYAYHSRCIELATTGVMLHPPYSYKRIDGSNSLPEFVILSQLKNLRATLSYFRAAGIKLKALEENSNVNFM
ncbi:hypothetical protein F9L16_06960 [Agarivorans sp. B2Z047]|uniref:hypothetical protein n=1 Tax=Agarivorans sp. B2Z047 TaxID=2652721 RepID=UPI00128D90CD|nr:hypothetical protein [Agarivorans sp. B2Z047]MPW28743.1 hypothetical protein [Agarivorans sp. B2Z047]UQN41304.1 hypothetical protein LQZ07_16165 [Agarivorans sp. B2Z047]